jgi:hypothetical protein
MNQQTTETMKKMKREKMISIIPTFLGETKISYLEHMFKYAIISIGLAFLGEIPVVCNW